MTVHGYVICAREDPTGVALINEGGRVNVFFHEIMLTLIDGTQMHAMFAFAAETIHAETELRAHYDLDGEAYDKVRVAKGYVMPPRDERGPAVFTLAEIENLHGKVRAAFDDDSLATALAYGGVYDYAVGVPDVNRPRAAGELPSGGAIDARPARSPAGAAAHIGATPAARAERAARRNPPPAPPPPAGTSSARGPDATTNEARAMEHLAAQHDADCMSADSAGVLNPALDHWHDESILSSDGGGSPGPRPASFCSAAAAASAAAGDVDGEAASNKTPAPPALFCSCPGVLDLGYDGLCTACQHEAHLLQAPGTSAHHQQQQRRRHQLLRQQLQQRRQGQQQRPDHGPDEYDDPNASYGAYGSTDYDLYHVTACTGPHSTPPPSPTRTIDRPAPHLPPETYCRGRSIAAPDYDGAMCASCGAADVTGESDPLRRRCAEGHGEQALAPSPQGSGGAPQPAEEEEWLADDAPGEAQQYCHRGSWKDGHRVKGRVGFYHEDEDPFGPLSNWFNAVLMDGHTRYENLEQFIMAAKAKTMGDYRSLELIMTQGADPMTCKRLGRNIKPYDETRWANAREEVARRGICLKFDQHDRLWRTLKWTGGLDIVEVSANDRVWGGGIDLDQLLRGDDLNGENLLGRALTRYRDNRVLHEGQELCVMFGCDTLRICKGFLAKPYRHRLCAPCMDALPCMMCGAADATGKPDMRYCNTCQHQAQPWTAPGYSASQPPADNGGGTLLHTSPSFVAQVHVAPPPARSEVHPARGVRQGVTCDEPTRRKLRRNRFALTPGRVSVVRQGSTRRTDVATICTRIDIDKLAGGDLRNIFHGPDAGKAYAEWLSSGDAASTVQQRYGGWQVGKPTVSDGLADELRSRAMAKLATMIEPLAAGAFYELENTCPKHASSDEPECHQCNGDFLKAHLEEQANNFYNAERAEEEAELASAPPEARPPAADVADDEVHPEEGAERATKPAQAPRDLVVPELRKRKNKKPAASEDTKKRRRAEAAKGKRDEEDTAAYDYELAMAMSVSAQHDEEEKEAILLGLPQLKGKLDTDGEAKPAMNLFAGLLPRHDGLAAATLHLGHPALELDNGASSDLAAVVDIDVVDNDLAKATVQRSVLLAIKRRLVSALLIGAPCVSYTVTHDLNDADPWRTLMHPGGRPDLDDAALAWLARQDALLTFSVKCMQAAIDAGVLVIFENPAPRNDPLLVSYWKKRAHIITAWHMTCMIDLRKRSGDKLRMVVVPQCAFGPGPHGKTFQKYTGLLCSAPAADYLESLGLARCRHAADAHHPVHGTDAAGASNSKHAAAYPGAMYLALAIALLGEQVPPSVRATAHTLLLASLPTADAPLAPPPPAAGPSAAASEDDDVGSDGDTTDTEGGAAATDADPSPPPCAGAPAQVAAPAPAPPPAPAPEQQATDAQAEGGGAASTDTDPSLPRPLRPIELSLGATTPAAAPEELSSTLPILHLTGTPGTRRDSIAIVPVRTSAITGAAPLALMPLHSGVFGMLEHSHARNGRREAVVDAASAATTGSGVAKDVCFLAGEVDADDGGFDIKCGARSSVVVAPCDTETMAAALATTAQEAATLRAAWAATDLGTEPQVWMTLDALAEEASTPDGTARYRVAATAIAMAEAHVHPTPEGPAFMRSGARAWKHAPAATSRTPAGPITLDERIRRADLASEELHAALLSQDAAADPAFAEFCNGLADQVRHCGTSQIPEEMLGTHLPQPPEDLLRRPFKHRAQVLHTTPKPRPAQQEPPANGWWPDSIEDIIKPEVLEKIRSWLRRCTAWHQAGGPRESRPPAEAYGEDALYPEARGRRWDLRGGKGNIKLWREYTPQECQDRTCVNLDFAKEIFADCIDKEFVEFLLAGVRFHAGLEDQIVLMPNLLSLYQDGGVGAAAAQADDMVRQGFIAVFEDLPSVPYRVIPRGVVPKAGTDELRGIADQGAPRKPLPVHRARRASGPSHRQEAHRVRWADQPSDPRYESTGPAGAERPLVEALNDKCRAGDWGHEDKDTLEHAASNGAILQQMADYTGEVTIQIALDMSKWFHRMYYDATDLWTTGAVIPSEATGSIKLAIEMAMTMGATPASQIAQRFANALIQQVCIAMDALEKEARVTSPLAHEVQAALEMRDLHIDADSYSTQGRLYDCLMYSDDAHALAVGVPRAIRFLRAFWSIAGPSGLNTPLSRASKQQIGVCVTWLGGTLAAGLGLVWIPREKVARAAHGLHKALANEMEVGDYRRLVGFLVSVLFMLGGDRDLLSFIFRPMAPHRELSRGPATLVICDPNQRLTLARWSALLLNTPGAAAMSAVEFTPRAVNAPRHRIRTDAALQGTPRPGLGGCLYGVWWALAIADCPGLEMLDIPHLELLAACIGLLTYADILRDAEHIDMDTDALATAVGLTNRAKSPALQAILSALHDSPIYKELAPRLGVSHLFGAANILSDAASRGYDETLQSVAKALGVTAKRIELSEAARTFLSDALDRLAKTRSGAGKGSTARGRQNLNLDGNMPVAHGGAGALPAPLPRSRAPRPDGAPGRPARHGPASPSAAPLPLHRSDEAGIRRASHTWFTAAPSTRTAPMPPPSSPPRPARGAKATRTPPSRSGLEVHPEKHHRTYAQAASPRAAPLPSRRGERQDAAAAEATRPDERRGREDLRDRFKRVVAEGARPEDHTPRSPRSAPLPVSRGRTGATAPNQRPDWHRPRKVSELDIARERIKEQLYDKIRLDTSEHAIHPEDDMLRWMCSVTQGDGSENPITTQSNQRSNWRHWEKYCQKVDPNMSPWRPNVEELDARGVERERVIWTAGLIWIYENSMKPKPGNYVRFGPLAGTLQQCKPASALAILRGVRKEHLDRGLNPPSLTLAARRMHEMTRRYAKYIGPENLTPRKKATLSHKLITGMLNVKKGTNVPYRRSRPSGRAATTDDAGGGVRTSTQRWAWDTQFGTSCSALFNTLAQTGFRKAEVALGNEDWSRMNISFFNLTWHFKNGVETDAPTAKQLFDISEGDYAVIRPPPSKCDPFSEQWGNSPIWLPYHPTATINAARALARWELKARVAPSRRYDTPLFCGPEGIGSPLTQGVCDDVFHSLLAISISANDETGEEGVPDTVGSKEYSVHSFRSFLASSMLAAGRTDGQIQAALRWASAEALAEYKMINKEVYGGWILGAEKQILTGRRACNLPRRTPQHDYIERVMQIQNERQECFREAALADQDLGNALDAETLAGRAEPNAWRSTTVSYSAAARGTLAATPATSAGTAPADKVPLSISRPRRASEAETNAKINRTK